jgi:hypothetical protein
MKSDEFKRLSLAVSKLHHQRKRLIDTLRVTTQPPTKSKG